MRFLESGYYPSLSMSEQVTALYVRCFGGVQGAARAFLQTILTHGFTTPSEAQCLEGVFGAMPENDLARVLASDSATIVRYRTQLRSCNGPYAGQA